MKAHIYFATIFFLISGCFLNAQNLLKGDLDDFIKKVIAENKLPGLSIAVVMDDSIIYAKGFGVRKTGEQDPVNEYTLYEGASITKSFTATLIGRLVDQGKLKWTDPVIKYFQGFETSEPFVTQNLTIQDLLTFRSGLMDGDKLRGKSRAELIPQIKTLKISNSFRLSQTSSNLNYALAGLIAEVVTGKSWEEMVTSEILSPLKMNETFTDIQSALSASINIAAPHRIKNGEAIVMDLNDYGAIYSPAEGIVTNVMDLAKWVRLLLNKGTFENISIIESETLAHMQSPQTISLNQYKNYFNPKANLMGIGLGWFISDYEGLKVVQMAGSFPGTTNLLTIIPSREVGIIIQTNCSPGFNSLGQVNYKILNDLLFQ
jgi:CubicO group peptidase (beta-lactamase class C family)